MCPSHSVRAARGSARPGMNASTPLASVSVRKGAGGAQGFFVFCLFLYLLCLICSCVIDCLCGCLFICASLCLFGWLVVCVCVCLLVFRHLGAHLGVVVAL